MEMYKVKDKLSPLSVQELFEVHDNTYDLRNKRNWTVPDTRTILRNLNHQKFPKKN